MPCTCVGDQPGPADARGARGREHLARELQRAVDALALGCGERRLERLCPILVKLDAAVVVVVHHHEQAGPATELPHRLDEGRSPERAVLVLERGREADRILDRRRLDHEAAVLVVLVPHRVRRDRIDHVRVLRLVEQPVDEPGRVEAEVAADQPAARAVRQARAQEQLRRVQRPRRDDDRTRVDARDRSVQVDVLDALRLAVLDQDPVDARVGAQLEPARRPGVVDVGVERRLARVRRAALEAGAAAHAVRVGVGAHRLQLRAESAEARLDGAHALPPIRSLADAEPLLHLVVVWIEVDDEPARLVPLGQVLRVRPQRHLRVDRGRAADTATGDQPDGPAGAAVDQGEPDRPPEIVRRLRLPAREVGGGLVRPELQQEHVSPAVRELARHDSAARTGADNDDIEPLAHPIPRYDQSFASRVARGVLKSISAHAPVASTPGATKSL